MMLLNRHCHNCALQCRTAHFWPSARGMDANSDRIPAAVPLPLSLDPSGPLVTSPTTWVSIRTYSRWTFYQRGLMNLSLLSRLGRYIIVRNAYLGRCIPSIFTVGVVLQGFTPEYLLIPLYNVIQIHSLSHYSRRLQHQVRLANTRRSNCITLRSP